MFTGDSDINMAQLISTIFGLMDIAFQRWKNTLISNYKMGHWVTVIIGATKKSNNRNKSM